MKRARSDLLPKRTGDIRKDLSESQLASFGAAALAYNEAEVFIDVLMMFALGLSPETAPDVSSRINGIDGKIEITKAAMRALGAAEDIQSLISGTLGESGFALLKGYRDGMIHARTLDAPSGIAGTSVKRGKFFEVLLSKEAMDGLYERLVVVRDELIEACNIASNLLAIRKIEQLKRQTGSVAPRILPVLDQTKAKLERGIRAAFALFQSHQNRRLSFPPLPEFPSESELQESHFRWMKDRQAERTNWHSTFSEPLAAPRLDAGEMHLQELPPHQPKE
jgi:hypothetical protein